VVSHSCGFELVRDMYDVSIDGPELVLILEYCDGGVEKGNLFVSKLSPLFMVSLFIKRLIKSQTQCVPQI